MGADNTLKDDSRGNKKRSYVKIISVLIMTFVLLMGVAFATHSNDVNSGLSDKLVRLHVIANSDSDEDQALKRDVRDVILKYMETELKGVKNVKQAKSIINKKTDKIQSLAKGEIERQGKDYRVKVMLGTYPFPTKLYGDISLPAGYYQALRVVIGKGEGANWWCVLFPPLCFVDATHGTIPTSVKNVLKADLSEEQYRLITTEDEETDIPIKVKFKTVEFFQSAGIGIAKFIGSIF
jgi:stage II sporulation protein R